jgi:hypothetical protein
MINIFKSIGTAAKKIPWDKVGKVILAGVPVITQIKKWFTNDRIPLAKKLKSLKKLKDKNEITKAEYNRLRKMLIDNTEIKDI